MKKILNYVKQKRWLVLMSGLTILFAACQKDINTTHIPTSGLMAVNLIPDKVSVGFVISNQYLTNTPLSYSNYSGTYVSVYSGNRSIGLHDVTGDSSLAASSMNFEAGKYYSAFALGANGHYQNLIVNDNLDSIPDSTSEAFVRYINAIPDSSKPMVTIAVGGTNVVNDANASYGGVSAFKKITPGDITIEVSNGTNISATRTITVEKGKVYTILLMGIPDATDEVNKVQVKFIVNGSVS